MGGKGPDEQTVTQQSRPPAWLEAPLKRAVTRGENLYTGDFPLYQEGFNPYQAAGMDAIGGAAGDPALIDPAVGYAGDVLGGEYLDPAALREAAAPAIGKALQGVRMGFEGAGGRGGSMEALATGEGVTRAIAPYYEAERKRQQQMAGMAPSLESARYGPGEALLRLGDYEQAQVEREQQEPWARYERWLQSMTTPGALAGGTQTTTQPVYQPSPLQTIAGLGMTGMGLAGRLGWRPFSAGAAAGAAPGGIG